MASESLTDRIGSLQTPLSRIGSLAAAILDTIEQTGPVEDMRVRTSLDHLTNFADLIAMVAQQASDEADKLELDVRAFPAPQKSEA